LLSQPASAVHPAPSTIEVSARVEDGSVVGRADVTFPDPTVIVGIDGTNDFADDQDLGPLAGPLGIDITELSIGLGNLGPSVEFTIKVADLQVPPPNEIIRYVWQFQVDGVEYWVQAKSSDIATVVLPDDPSGAATRLNGAFRLRGNCGPLATLNNCAHLMWLQGEFNLASDEVRMRVPIGDPRAPHFVAGAEITPDPEAVTASIQVVVSNATTSDTAFQDESFVIPSPAEDWSAAFGIGAPDSNPDSIDYALGFGPSFCGIRYQGGPWARCEFTLEPGIPAPPPGSYRLFARVCVEGACIIGSGPFDA